MSAPTEQVLQPVASSDISMSDKKEIGQDVSDKPEQHEHSKGSILQGTLQGPVHRELTLFERKAHLINE
jgi:hypothetical protein